MHHHYYEGRSQELLRGSGARKSPSGVQGQSPCEGLGAGDHTYRLYRNTMKSTKLTSFPEKQQHDWRYVYVCISCWKLYVCIHIILHSLKYHIIKASNRKMT